jgi:hypothetical protein
MWVTRESVSGYAGSNPVGATSQIASEHWKGGVTMTRNRIPAVATFGHGFSGFATAMATCWQRTRTEFTIEKSTVDNTVGGVLAFLRPGTAPLAGT